MNCPNCQQTVSEDAATCPNCGHELNPVVVGSEPAEAAASRRPGWLVFGVAGVLVLALGVAAFALVGGNETASARYAGRFPADATAYLEVDLEVLTSGDVRSVIEAFQPLAELSGEEELDVDDLMDEMIGSVDEGLAEIDLTYADDIQSWASGVVAVAMFGDPAEFDESAAFVAAGEDPSALDEMLEKLSARSSGTYEAGGSDFLILDEGSGEPLYLGRVGNDLVGGSSTELVDSMVAAEGETLADVEAFGRQMGALPAGGLLSFAIDNEAAVAGSDMYPMTTDMFPGATPTGWTAFRLGVDEGNLRMDLAATTPEGIEMTGGDDTVLDAIPSEAIAFLRVGSLFEQYRTLADSEVTAGMEEMYGIGLDQIFSLFARDGAIAVWPSSDPELPVNAMLAALGDGDQSATIDALADLASDMQTPATETDWGYLFEGLIGLGARDDFAILSTQTDLIVDAPSESFAGSDLYRRASELVSGDVQLALDVPAVIDMVDGLVAASGDPETAEVLSCLPFGTAAAGMESSGADVRSTFVLEIEPRC